MPKAQPGRVRTHALLIGIDDYAVAPLGGCVLDALAMRELLIGTFGVAPDEITLLLAPRGPLPDATSSFGSPTAEAIRARLDVLASDQVGSEDRVIVHYAGHGASQMVRLGNRRHAIECLVPVDALPGARPQTLIYDAELDRRLAAIEARTAQVTFVLDCCHSAGVTRHALLGDAVARTVVIDDAPTPPAQTMPLSGLRAPRARALIVAACLADELALEVTGRDGVRRGVLTSAVVEALEATEGHDTTWREVWPSLLTRARPRQNPAFFGDDRHSVFGPLVTIDRSELGVSPRGDHYAIEAGNLNDIDVGSVIAVYGQTPERFAAVGSPADLSDRVGTIVVEASTATTARGRGESDFPWPTGARCRVASYAVPPLAVSTSEPLREEVRALVERSAHARLTEREVSDVHIVRLGSQWVLCDDVHGLAAEGRPELHQCTEDDLPWALAAYARYRAPLRLAARTTDFPGALVLRVLDARAASPAMNAQAPELPDVARAEGYPCVVRVGDPFCLLVENRSAVALRSLGLFNCGKSGRVEHLAAFVLAPGSQHAIWAGERLGTPFTLESPGVERLVVVASTDPSVDWRSLASETTFRSPTRDFGAPPRPWRYAATSIALRVLP